MKIGDPVVVIKPMNVTDDETWSGPSWVDPMDAFIGDETRIRNCNIGSNGTVYYYIEGSTFLWKKEWLRLDKYQILKTMPIDEVVAKLEKFTEISSDEYSHAIEELICAYESAKTMLSAQLIDSMEVEMRGSLEYFESKFVILQREVKRSSYVESYLEER